MSLTEELAARPKLRPASYVMSPAVLGAARLTRYSFSRMLLRAAVRGGWTVRRTHFELDDLGQGQAIYEWHIGGDVYSFVAFTQVLDESMHTDRVVASDWEITGALVEGVVGAAELAQLRAEVPRQEQGRLDPSVLVLTRGNRSVRFFDYLVESLASGRQPDPDLVGDAGYIMRSTAFYGNGKFGMRSFGAFGPEHPLGVPYRAQFASALLFRELSYDSVEHCARARGGSTAVGFDHQWRTFFGLGNATGLGLVPYAFKHPAVLHAWAAVREIALADVRSMPATLERADRLAWWIERARLHFASGTDENCAPFLSPVELVPTVDAIATEFGRLRSEADAFDRLYHWAEAHHVETAELVASLLIELHEGDDALVDRMLRVSESASIDPAMTVAELAGLTDERFGWIDDLDLAAPDADELWWVISDNNEEPRRVSRRRLAPEGRDVAIDIAARVRALRDLLDNSDDDGRIGELLRARPELRLAVERVLESTGIYGEPRDNACSAGFLPLQTQRFQLAFYGMDNFKPKSTDWLRVTLFQGAPRAADLLDPTGFDDAWVLPARPDAAQC